ncbi:MAG TPA: hypothetical protein VNO20_00500 [Solirubrobacterales bacterium]|nr:hypothetical protein [Solirubrobacterales bacterium]
MAESRTVTQGEFPINATRFLVKAIIALWILGIAFVAPVLTKPAQAANDRLLFVMDSCCSIGAPGIIRGPLTTADAGTGGAQASSGIEPARGRIFLSPNGRLMAYQSEVETLSVAGVDGSNPQVIASPATGYSFNSDGTELLMGGSACPGICWINLQTGAKKATSIAGEPSLSPDGTKVVWVALGLAKKTTDTENLFVANPDGSGAVQITNFTSKSTPPGVWGTPQFGPKGIIAFWGGDIAFTKLWTISSNGTNLEEISEVNPNWFSWTPSGQINFTHYTSIAGSECGIYTMNPDGSNISRVPVNSEETCFEPINDKIPKAVYRQPAEGSSEDYLAHAYEPVLRFDSSEEWRPLNIDSFFGEEQHQVCEGESCSLISSAADLNLHTGSNAEINIAGSYNEAGDEENYHSPYEECTATGLRDCDTGSRSAIYYRIGGTYGGYQYIDYWFYYRANYFTNQLGWHEGDWEGVTVAPSPTSSTFDYAAFSQHGTFYSYLRDVLRCEDAPGESVPASETCGTESQHTGHRVAVFPANGTHANYTTPCSEQIILVSCSQNGPGSQERGYDGADRWGRAFDHTGGSGAALLPMPDTGKELWSDWPGQWGTDSSSPISPALQPVDIECASLDNGEGCVTGPRGEEEGAFSAFAAEPGGTPVSPGLSALRCSSWTGPEVAVTACDPKLLRKAVMAGSVGASGSFDVSVPEGSGVAAEGSGIAQYLDSPLESGDEVKIAGHVTPRSQVVVRVSGHGRQNLVAKIPVGQLMSAEGNPGDRALRLRLRVWREDAKPHVSLGGVEALGIKTEAGR